MTIFILIANLGNRYTVFSLDKDCPLKACFGIYLAIALLWARGSLPDEGFLRPAMGGLLTAPFFWAHITPKPQMETPLKIKYEILEVHVYDDSTDWTQLIEEFCGICLNDNYRFERINRDEYWVSYFKSGVEQFRARVRTTP